MCNRAGGLIARVIESTGIPTVCLSINRAISEKVVAPRTGFVKFPYGAVFGEPNKRAQQMTILMDLFRILQTEDRPGHIVDLPYLWRRSTYSEVPWESPSC